ncbi:hypothetical protein MWN33_12715 [Starkeya koreensis]|uniref:Outer membrane protein beta-barrel domain-containing protein n=1 Tax=Ancylobacter koreensis TaxID=266121 RepID=A0ABT0DNN9_9HYPH|nr:hypothetical protein [Ancylobacter koreensis]MCK0208893.1 hypothetical protein [Ancylobacter koreensis]
MPAPRRLLALVAILAAPTLAPAAALAGSTSIGGAFTTERAVDAFADTTSSDWQIDVAHSFDNKFSLAGSVKYYDTAGTSDYKVNAQFGGGYTWELGTFALTAGAGVGQHFVQDDDPWSFPYYYFTLAGALPLGEKWTWNVFRLRYRNAFDNSNGYNTPEAAMGVTYRVDAHNSVSLYIERDWTNGQPAYDGIEIGYRYSF